MLQPAKLLPLIDFIDAGIRIAVIDSHPQKANGSISSKPSGSSKPIKLVQELKPPTDFNPAGKTRVRKLLDSERPVSLSPLSRVFVIPCGRIKVSN